MWPFVYHHAALLFHVSSLPHTNSRAASAARSEVAASRVVIEEMTMSLIRVCVLVVLTGGSAGPARADEPKQLDLTAGHRLVVLTTFDRLVVDALYDVNKKAT